MNIDCKGDFDFFQEKYLRHKIPFVFQLISSEK